MLEEIIFSSNIYMHLSLAFIICLSTLYLWTYAFLLLLSGSSHNFRIVMLFYISHQLKIIFNQVETFYNYFKLDVQ